jgi:hypothetical protein
LFSPSEHNEITTDAVAKTRISCPNLPADVALVDSLPHSQDPENSHWHAMRNGKNPGATAESAQRDYETYVQQSWNLCTCQGLARAIHAVQDSHAAGHAGFQRWSGGIPSASHLYHDGYPSKDERGGALSDSMRIIRQYQANCKKSCLAN